LGPNTYEKLTTPVTLPPGRLILAITPVFIGSPPNMETIGIVAVAALAARGGPPPLTITLTFRPTRSAAERRQLLVPPFGPPVLHANVLVLNISEFIQSWRNAATRYGKESADPGCRKPITGSGSARI
jgi:hypothetical protein